MNQYGGLQLKVGENQINDFSPIVRMLNSSSMSLTLLSSGSLKGFIYTLTVSEEDSAYFDLNPQSGFFNIPVTSYILKVVIISETANEEIQHRYESEGNGTFEKSTESEESLIYESKIQMAAWQRSVENGNPMVCPSIANLKIFENNGDSLAFIEYLKQRPNAQNEYTTSLQYLLHLLSSDIKYRIGVLTMPNIAGSVTYMSFMSRERNEMDEMRNFLFKMRKKYVSIQLVTQIIRLFLQSIVIHFDLHPENALVTTTDQVVIIDFGSASDISNGTNDEFIDEGKKTEYFGVLNNFKTRIISGRASNKIETIKDIMKYIISIENSCNYFNMRRLFNTVSENGEALETVYNLVKQRIEPIIPRPNLDVHGLLFINPSGEIDTRGNTGVLPDTVCRVQTIGERVAEKHKKRQENIDRMLSLRSHPNYFSEKTLSRGGKRTELQKIRKKRTKRSKKNKTSKRPKRKRRN